MCKKLI